MKEPPLVLASIGAAVGISPTGARLAWAMFRGAKLNPEAAAILLRTSSVNASVHLFNLRNGGAEDWFGADMVGDGPRNRTKTVIMIEAGRVAVRAILADMRDQSLAALANYG